MRNKRIAIISVIIVLTVLGTILYGKTRIIAFEDMVPEISECKDVNIYELTENSYIEGVDYNCSPEEVKKLVDILKKQKVTKRIGIPMEKPDYILYFYDKEGEELFSLGIYEENVRLENGTLTNEKEVKNWLQNTIKDL